jgi:hypothetical protein
MANIYATTHLELERWTAITKFVDKKKLGAARFRGQIIRHELCSRY